MEAKREKGKVPEVANTRMAVATSRSASFAEGMAGHGPQCRPAAAASQVGASVRVSGRHYHYGGHLQVPPGQARKHEAQWPGAQVATACAAVAT